MSIGHGQELGVGGGPVPHYHVSRDTGMQHQNPGSSGEGHDPGSAATATVTRATNHCAFGEA